MASVIHGVWAIDIGSNTLKALRFRQGQDGLEVIGFDYIEHSRILSSPDVNEVEREEIIEETLHKFAEKNDVGKDEVAISVAGHNSFSRFIKLPPVSRKRIPEIVQFEAVQQIPFDIDEVEWDWQLMTSEDNPNKEVGIFAIKNEVVGGLLSNFNRERMGVSLVQVGPMALYNYAYYDRQDVREDDGKAVVILDMGTENTMLVVCSKEGVWQRSIRIGGNTFTEAIEEAFKLSFSKAEKLKRTAPMSKYMRQIFTAMKPVYTDMAGEIQRSLSFYTSSGPGREKGFSKVIALGGGMKLQGLAKYLGGALGVPVVRPDSFERLKLSPEVSAARFHENVGDFGIVYGLGVQLLDEPKIDVNLLPRRIARQMSWSRKAKYFTVAACLLLAVSILSLANVIYASSRYKSKEPVRRRYADVERMANTAKSNIETEKGRAAPLKEAVTGWMDLFKYRDVVASVNKTIIDCLPNAENNPEQVGFYEAFANADVAGITSLPRRQRKQLFITGLSIEYAPSLKEAKFGKVVQERKEISQDFMMDRERMDRERRGDREMMDDPRYAERMGMMMPEEDDGDGPGFVLIIEGYSPYGNLDELMDPPQVVNDKDQLRWGFITRLRNLAKVFPGISFELYEHDDLEHFKLETGQVDIYSSDTPLGIGIETEVERIPREAVQPGGREMLGDDYGRGGGFMGRDDIRKEKVYGETVLLDPMTNEEISTTSDIYKQEDIEADSDLTEKDIGRRKYTEFGRPKFIINDHWFRLQAKFLWTAAPKPEIPTMPMRR